MIPTAFGIPSSLKTTASYGTIQNWLHDHGLTPYMPHMRYATSANLPMMTDVVARTLARTARNGAYGLDAVDIAEMQRFGLLMLASYGSYYYSTAPGTWQWLCEDDVKRGQDDLTLEQMADYYAIVQQWCVVNGIDAYLFIDELPHKAVGTDPYKWGWSLEVEARGIKTIQAAQQGGLKVALACPPALAVEYWAGQGVQPDIWLTTDPATPEALEEKHLRCDHLFAGKSVWLYNSQVVAGLADRIRSFNPQGGGGYLYWSVTAKNLPLFSSDGIPTPAMLAITAELEMLDKPIPPVEPPDPDRIVVLEAAVASLIQQVAALETDFEWRLLVSLRNMLDRLSP